MNFSHWRIRESLKGVEWWSINKLKLCSICAYSDGKMRCGILANTQGVSLIVLQIAVALNWVVVETFQSYQWKSEILDLDNIYHTNYASCDVGDSVKSQIHFAYKYICGFFQLKTQIFICALVNVYFPLPPTQKFDQP